MRDFISEERKSQAVELGKGDILEAEFSHRKYVFQRMDGGGADIRLTLLGPGVAVHVRVCSEGHYMQLCVRQCMCACLVEAGRGVR